MADDLTREAERITLGSMMLASTAIESAAGIVTAADFADVRHRWIFEAIVRNHAAGAQIDPVGVAIGLNAAGVLRQVGGAVYLAELVACVPTAASVGWYAERVADAAQARAAAADAARLLQVAEAGDAEKIAAEKSRLIEAWSGTPPRACGSWRPVDLTAVLSGDHDPALPTVGRRDDGVGLFYPGRLHTVASESEGGKTWLLMVAAAAEMNAGHAVLYLDFEDDEAGVVGRLLALGAGPETIAARFCYIRPDEAITALGNRADLAQALGDLRPRLAVLDGITEAMSLHGLEMKDNTDIARFGKLLPRWIADQGPASVGLDHVTKDRDTRGRYAIGGVHKLNGVNGAALLLENRVPFGIGNIGRSSVLIAKDRPGQLRRHALPAGEGLHWLADLVIDSPADAAGTYVEARLARPNGDAPAFRPTALMAKISAALAHASAPLSKQDIEARVRGKRVADVRTALAALIDEEYVTVSRGPRGAILHALVKPFGGETDGR